MRLPIKLEALPVLDHPTDPDLLYRVEERVHGRGYIDEFDNYHSLPGYEAGTTVVTFEVIRRTKCGVWIDDYGVEKFVNLGARKQYASETVKEAAEQFYWRKRRQVKILRAQLERAEIALGMAINLTGREETCNKQSKLRL